MSRTCLGHVAVPAQVTARFCLRYGTVVPSYITPQYPPRSRHVSCYVAFLARAAATSRHGTLLHHVTACAQVPLTHAKPPSHVHSRSPCYGAALLAAR